VLPLACVDGRLVLLAGAGLLAFLATDPLPFLSVSAASDDVGGFLKTPESSGALAFLRLPIADAVDEA
jgi:hypothetical protein